LNEKLAAKFPPPSFPPFDYTRGSTRRPDGTLVRP
jgi:hypothetical protein